MKIPRNKAAKGKQTKARKKEKKPPESTRSSEPPPTSAPTVPKVWQPGDGIEDDEELDFDPSAYDCLVRFTDTWPSLSFDIISDPTTATTDFPHTLYFVSGTQAPNARDNFLNLIKVKDIQRLRSKEKEETMDTSSSSSSESDDEGNEDSAQQKEHLYHHRIRHSNGINRLRSMPQNPPIVAVWSDNGIVQILQLGDVLDQVAADHSTAETTSIDALFQYQHKSEGFALDWSRVRHGLLASGDCKSGLNVWQPRSDAQWEVLPCTNGHAASVEDIQWSPSEETVFASASVDKTIKIWDCRDTNGARLTTEASSTDVNVLSWNKDVTYMLASGDDRGVLKIWDLRQFQHGTHIAEFAFHKQSITSLEWSPHESSMLATSDDDQIAIWDLALERDPEEEAQFAAAKNAQLPPDVPPQLLFLHAGQKRIKELHWNPQVHGMIMSTAEDGMNIFKASNI